MSASNTNDQPTVTRRKFITYAAATAGTALLLKFPLVASAMPLETVAPVTVKQIIELFISQVPGGAKANTVDTLKSGRMDMVVTGIVTTMFPTIEVIRKAIAVGANFIIAHEPTFYNHADETQWLEHDSVYQYKANLLKQHNITVWRNHDYIHTLTTDGVRKALVEQLGWQNFGNPNQNLYYPTPVPTLGALINHAKHQLGISQVRYIGDLKQPCKKVLLMPGAAGGTRQIGAIMQTQPDVLVCGEISEWETAEYVRDARASGKSLALVVLGHIASEEAGSTFMEQWVKQYVPGMKVQHIPAGNSLMFA